MIFDLKLMVRATNDDCALQRGQLKRPDHADLRFKCRTYARMLQHLKVCTSRRFKEQCSMYSHKLFVPVPTGAFDFIQLKKSVES
jgi:hypothetical protein